ncbi:hypothetical protein HOY82DRAFT_624852 [Tuber indicum]|nr:hypothetical protein HOY82DRAFT_624852 [Tuber indicum]
MLTISLANRGLLRKFRDTETEDLVSGKEYFARLHRQFEKIYPVPKKKARLYGTGAGSIGEEMDGVGVEEKAGEQEALRSAPSHEEILRGTTNWTLTVPGKLRPGKLTMSTSTPLVQAYSPLAAADTSTSGTSQQALSKKVTRIYGHAEVQRSVETFHISPERKFMALAASHSFVNILNSTTYQWVCAAKIADRVADISWWGDNRGLTMGNKAGGIWGYGNSTCSRKKVVARRNDKGGHVTTVLKNSGTTWIAIGSQSRIVNVYDHTGG